MKSHEFDKAFDHGNNITNELDFTNAQLYRINWLGNTSSYGMERSHGLMVNYLYDLKQIEKNHEAYVQKGELAVSKSVRGLVG